MCSSDLAEFRAFMSRRIEGALQRADLIIAVSHSVKEQLAAARPQHAEKIRVVHHGMDAASAVDEPQRLALLRLKMRGHQQTGAKKDSQRCPCMSLQHDAPYRDAGVPPGFSAFRSS